MFPWIRNIHFVGIGGIGMSGIAELLINQGFRVTGSDLAASETTAHLQSLGAKVYEGHAPEHVEHADIVVYSSAVSTDNPEVRAAMKRNIPVIKRAEMLSEVMRLKYGIGVAGTHGKTTTTSLIGVALIEGGLDPTVLVGGKLHELGGSNAHLGKGEFAVVEADEYDRTFLQLSPTIAVLTTLEEEHLDIYRDLADIQDAFVQFANKVPFYGFVVLCSDEAHLQSLRPRLNRKIVTYGTSPDADYSFSDPAYTQLVSEFTVHAYGQLLGTVRLRLPGEHNVKNALAAIAVGRELGIDFDRIKSGLEHFAGVYRRCEILADIGGILVMDDYAHHPTEVEKTLRAIKQGWNRRIVAVFQPHTYTRTRDFADRFGKALLDADVALVTAIYPAREEPIAGVTGERIVEAAHSAGHGDVRYVEEKSDIVEVLAQVAKPGDIVISIGAGDIYQYVREFVERLKSAR
ncbi:MAG: UDP-N-acetylmuramate--L-alanine ligase [Chlorobi bacterium]|nr:UDP-N-acetylmuramate--L-alanine ligase [Chlorobiota bacterium]